MQIYLTGFMGCGKTTVGRLLAERLDLPFVDLDGEIERRAGRSIGEIFSAEGEEGFRRRESAELAAVAGRGGAVVATGGGAVTREGNVATMRRHGVTVWLRPSFATLCARLDDAGRGERPLFADEAAARALYRRRLAAYRGASDHVVRVPADETAEKTAARVVARVAGSGAGGEAEAGADAGSGGGGSPCAS